MSHEENAESHLMKPWNMGFSYRNQLSVGDRFWLLGMAQMNFLRQGSGRPFSNEFLLMNTILLLKPSSSSVERLTLKSFAQTIQKQKELQLEDLFSG